MLSFVFEDRGSGRRLGVVRRLPAVVCAALWLAAAGAAPAATVTACRPAQQIIDATAERVRSFFASDGRRVVTFLGYSGAEYEDRAAMLAHAERILDRLDPGRTLINIGATADGIGAVYEMAKRRGFTTTGIVSMEARRAAVALSSCVDTVFFVDDETWGGFLPGTRTLSPTSAAMVGVSEWLIAIGGGEVTRDEFLRAKQLGRRVTFIPADMNHRLAAIKAAHRGAAMPEDFRGALDEALRQGRGVAAPR